MKFISHRGNLSGPNPSLENSPSYINQALEAGYDVEVDVWVIDNRFYLGHDEPQYLVTQDYLENEKLWVHCKNAEALQQCIKNQYVHCFFHASKEPYILTSKAVIWCYPGQPVIKNSICVLPELNNINKKVEQ